MIFIWCPIQLEAALGHFTILFTILLSLTRSSFYPAYISTPKWAYNTCCHYRRKALLKYIAITSCQVLIYSGWVNQSPHDGIAAHRASNPWPFGHEYSDLTKCAITVGWCITLILGKGLLKIENWAYSQRFCMFMIRCTI